jgi:selenocysteine-specific elongation factor
MLHPGETALCQVVFPRPMVGVYGDRFVIRSFSPLRTIAGGKILNPCAQRLKRFSNQLNNLEQLRDSNPETLVLAQLHFAGINGLKLSHLRVMINCSQKKLERIVSTLGSQQKIVSFDKENPQYLLADIFSSYKKELLDFIGQFHKINPMQAGISRSMIASNWGKELHPKLLYRLIEQCLKEGQLVADQDLLHLPEHKVTLASDQSQLKKEVLQAYIQNDITPPNLNNLLDTLKTNRKDALPVLRLLTEEGHLVKVKEELYFSTQALERIKQTVQKYFQENSELSPLDFKTLTGLSRKFSIPLLEYLDKAKITIRVGDIRKLRRTK